jgi:hypothetical protein
VSREIHVIRKDGQTYYREWSTVSDSYTTTPTTNLEAFKKLLFDTEMERCRREFEEEFPQRIERALARGTSRHWGERSLDEWNEERG